MAVSIYPDAATAALLTIPVGTQVSLPNGIGMAAFTPLAGHVGPDPSLGNLPTTFIRISMSGATSSAPPQVELKAVNPAAVTEGTAVVITATASGMAQGLLDGSVTNTTDAASAYFFPPHVDNVYLLKVVINISGTTLKMKITNNTGTQRDFVWVVGDSDANSQQPWIHVTPTVLTYDVLVNQTSTQTAQSLQIINRGTGRLIVNGVTPAIAAPYTITGLPATIGPNASLGNVIIGFTAPGASGTTALASFTVSSTDADDPQMQKAAAPFGVGHNRQFSLSATTRKLEIAMVLDDSGSMNSRPDGTYPNPPDPTDTRWSHVETASKHFLELLAAFGENKGTFGIVKFPGQENKPVDDLTTYDLVQQQAIPNVSGMVGAKNLVDGVTPFNATPMNYGLQRALTASLPYFATDSMSRDTNVRWMLLLSDGAWNEGADPRTSIPQLAAAKIKVYAVGFGTAGEVDYATLQALSTDPGTTPGGQSVQVTADASYDYNALAHTFKAAIVTGLTSVNSAADPTGVLYAGAAERRHPIIITPYDTRAAFVVTWDTLDAARMVLQLMTPTCDLLTPDSTAHGSVPGVAFSSDARRQLYVIDETYLRNDTNPSQPRHGTWQVIVSSPELAQSVNSQDRERYAYDVLVESSLRMQVTLDRAVYYAGDPIGVSARLSVDGVPIAHAAVKMEVTGPGQSMANWLAPIAISPEEYKRAADMLSGKDTNRLHIKSFAAQLKGLRFDSLTNKATIAMTDPDNIGVYSASFSQTTTPDNYTLYVSAVGTTAEGVMFRRDRTLQVRLGVRPDPDCTLFDVVYTRPAPASNLMTAVVHVTPRDCFGNVILLDPEISPDIILQARGGAKLVDKLTTNLDGTYTTTLIYNPGATPMVSLAVAGTPVFKDRLVAPVDQLLYVDQVLAFKLGAEAVKGANQHADPKAALGDFRLKGPDVFVSLGAYGSLAFGIQGQVILPQGDDDVTVFVQPDDRPRSYLVEALPVGDRDIWISLGKSAGTTQSFSLKRAGLEAAWGIRITDTSGRTRDGTLKPISTPGVSIRGVGVRRVTRRKGKNLLSNPEFELVGPKGMATSFAGDGDAGYSAAAYWTVSNNTPGATDTELVTGRGPSEAPTMIRVTTKGKGNGLVQVFGGLDTGPESVIGSAWVYVVHGAVGIGTGNGGKTRLDMQSTSSGSWELLSARNEVSPANQFIIYSASDGAIFYVAYAEAIEIPGP